MKSPITGKEMFLITIKENIEYKDVNNLIYEHNCYMCEDSGERFTTSELDTLNMTNIGLAYNEFKKING